jgi:flagellar biosynthesis protein FliQ
MSAGALLELWRTALITLAYVAAPLLIVALAIGLVISVVQAATQLQEQVLSFLPKLVGIAVVTMIGASWFIEKLTGHMSGSFELLVELGKGVVK